MERQEGTSRKRKTVGQLADPIARSRLHHACVQLLGRELEVGDVVYKFDNNHKEGGDVAEITLPSLPAPWGQRSWRGTLCTNRRLARQSAADAALRDLLADPDVAGRLQGFEDMLDCSNAVPSSSSSTAPPGDDDVGSQKQHVEASSVAAAVAKGTDARPKAQLVIFCQRSCGRPMSKDDIVYTMERQAGQYVATVQVNCFNGERFVGKPQPDRKQAEHSAAEEVLRAKASERAKIFHKPSSKRQRLQEPGREPEHPDAKTRLHDACVAILGRPPQAGDVVYEVIAGNSGPRATLRLPFLPGNLGQKVFESGTCSSRTDARAKAAALALQSLSEDDAHRHVLK